MIFSSIFIGLLFGSLNFWLLSRMVRGLVASEQVKKWKLGLFFFLKMGLLFLTIGLILKKGYVTPLPFIAGFTVSLIVLIAFKALRK